MTWSQFVRIFPVSQLIPHDETGATVAEGTFNGALIAPMFEYEAMISPYAFTVVLVTEEDTPTPIATV